MDLDALGSFVRQGLAHLGFPTEGAAAAGAADVEATVQEAGAPRHAPRAAPAAPVPAPQYAPPMGGGVEPVRYEYSALISVHDKEGVVQLAKELSALDKVQLLSTGGTFRLLVAAELPVAQLDADTGFPEILGGKWGTRCMANTLHAQVVARRQRLHESEELRGHGLAPIDVVVMNLFLFGATIQPHTSAEDAVEDIDLGTPTMLRAAARNYANVLVLVDPADYGWVAARLSLSEQVTLEERRLLAYKAYRHAALYDLSVAQYLGGGSGVVPEPLTEPAELVLGWRKLCTVRAAAGAAERDATVYAPLLEEGAAVGGGGICAARKLSGPELTLQMLTDSDVAWRAIVAFTTEACCCASVMGGFVTGIAAPDSADLADAFQRATAVYQAVGSVLAFSGPVSGDLAADITAEGGSSRWAAVLAPAFDEEALAVFRAAAEAESVRRQSSGEGVGGGAAGGGGDTVVEVELTLLEVPLLPPDGEADEDEDDDEELNDQGSPIGGRSKGGNPWPVRAGAALHALELTPLTGGGIVVREPMPTRDQASWTVVSDERPTAQELRDLVFAWRLLPHLPPSAIVLCRDHTMISPSYTWADQAQGASQRSE